MIAQLPISNPDLTACYEILRAQALGKGFVAETSLDMSLFLQEGMASWLEARSRPKQFHASKAVICQESTPKPSRSTLRAEATMVLASMITGAETEVK